MTVAVFVTAVAVAWAPLVKAASPTPVNAQPSLALGAQAFPRVPAALGETIAADGGEMIFTDYTPLASAAEVARRSLAPLDAEAAHVAAGPQLVNLAEERFFVRVPAVRPAQGYGVLVFIPPWDNGRNLVQWWPVLDRFGLIFVSALRSGNGQSTLARREPLAILAAHNVARRYSVDSARVFVGGFSGGSRVAMRVALAYPDLFRGALLDAGSDPIGGRDLPLPPRNLFDLFRKGSRLSYVTGALDEANLQLDADSSMSMRRQCVSNISTRQIAGLGHEVMNGAMLAAALSELMRPAGESPTSANCWSRMTKEIDSKLDSAATLAVRNPTAVRDLLIKIDRQYGGLAAPRILNLWRAVSKASPAAPRP